MSPHDHLLQDDFVFCPSCEEIKTGKDFYSQKNASGKRYRDVRCKKCTNRIKRKKYIGHIATPRGWLAKS